MKVLYLLISMLFVVDAVAAEKEALLQTTTGWDGSPLSYPAGDAEITASKITLEPKEQLNFHCHPVPILAYILAGEIEIESLNGQTKRFKQNQAFAETINRWHRGRNLSDSDVATLVMFSVGGKGTPDTIMMNDDNQSVCQP